MVVVGDIYNLKNYTSLFDNIYDDLIYRFF